MTNSKFLIGSLVCIKKTGKRAIVAGDYAFLCQRSSFDTGKELSLALLDKEGNICDIVCWFSPDEVEILSIPDSLYVDNLISLYNFSHSAY